MKSTTGDEVSLLNKVFIHIELIPLLVRQRSIYAIKLPQTIFFLPLIFSLITKRKPFLNITTIYNYFKNGCHSDTT
jgi:hypothetical protein